MERVIRRVAHGKINSSLRVLGRRPDGYHDIESLIVPISLADELTFRGGGELRLTITGELADVVPLDEFNLVVRAARGLAEAASMEPLADVELDKRIPVAAGLGGGSADAAATLSALNELWGCGFDDDALLEIGASVGSDVPALMAGTPVRVRGRGEILERVDVARAWWVLVPQPVAVLTADAYRWWDEDGGPNSPPGTGDHINDLEGPVATRHPQILEAKALLLEEGCSAALMCGSGPTVAGLAQSEEEARRIAEAVAGSIAVIAPP